MKTKCKISQSLNKKITAKPGIAARPVRVRQRLKKPAGNAPKAKRSSKARPIGADLSEHSLQALVFEHWEARGNKTQAVMFAIPNGGFRHIATATRLKREGVKAGVMDIFAAHQQTGAFWIELKRFKGKRSDAQIEMATAMQQAGQTVLLLDNLAAILAFLEDKQILKGKSQ